MRRLLAAVLIAFAVTTALASARPASADVTFMFVSSSLDQASPQHPLTISVYVKATQDITSVRAWLRQPDRTSTPFATVEGFTLAKGTVRDGTWTATYPLSIADHPGTGYIEAQAVAADGVTRSVSNTFRSCYPSKFTDLVVTPATIDADHPDVTIRGMLGYTTSADSPPQPAAGIRVFLASAEVTTDAQGGFAISAHLDGEPLLQTWGPGSIFVQGVVCATSATPAVTVNKQQTQVTGRVVTVQPVAPGAAVTLQGTLVRLSPTAGRVPAPGAEMEAWMYSEATAENVYLGTVFTGADGAFSIVATAPPYPTSGPVTLQHVPNADGFLLPSQAVVGRIDTHPRATAT